MGLEVNLVPYIFEMMIYPESFEHKINFNTVRDLIFENCLGKLGQEQVAAIYFSSDYKMITKWLQQTAEFLQILQNKVDFPTPYCSDMRTTLTQIANDDIAWLAEKEILPLVEALETIGQIVDFFNTTDSVRVKYPELKKLSDSISTFPTIIEKANSILDKSGQIKDNASKLLNEVRKSKIGAAKDITKNMHAAIRNAQAQGLIGQDVQADMRGGYYLIPVTASNKRKIKGIQRDGSGSGKTVYIEPEAVAEASSRLRDLENDERREISRILMEFTNLVRPDLSAIRDLYNFMGTMDFIRAKAMLALRIRACSPILENRPCMEWNQAKHPLLDIALRQQRQEAQPLDIRLTPSNRILIISGVNAGGKSLCLKTAALLQYMLQCGLLIPVDSHSKAGVFDHIFMDIGDGQNMENSLSTYTAHLTNMKYFIEHCNSRTLLLIDEFGGGTEPQIGGAIAETLLAEFNKKQSFGLITTHFENLKHFAYRTAGVINGAMLYDSENMIPLYKLSIGHPGSSLAIEVARRIGLPERLISNASKKIGEEFVNMDSLPQSIVRDKLYWESQRKEIDTNTASCQAEVRRKAVDDIERVEQVKNISLEHVTKMGDKVQVYGQTAVGTVVEIQGKYAILSFGIMKSKVSIDRLIRVP